MAGSRPPRRRRRTTGVVPTISGNELFLRVREELELFLTPRRAAEVLDAALRSIGATPSDASFGHMVQIVDVHLKRALEEACEPEEAAELHTRVCKVLDDLASRFFNPS
jgi:hypothetical protein